MLNSSSLVADVETPLLDSAPSEARWEPAIGSTLEKEVAECLPAIPVLCRQLTDTVSQIEGAVVAVCGGFQGIANRAQESTARLEQFGANAEGSAARSASIQRICEAARGALDQLLQRIDQASQQSREAVKRMQEVVRGMQEIEKQLKAVDFISASAKILALNAKIEAARVGEQGKAFGIVATETARLAEHAGASSRSIRAVLYRATAEVQGTSATLTEGAEQNARAVQVSRGEVDRVLQVMASAHEEMQEAVAASAQLSQDLSRDIAQAVMGLQFQDMVSQRVLHVVEALQHLRSALAQHLPEDALEENKLTSAWTDRLERHYTMAAERQAMAVERGMAADDAGLGANVELF